MNRKIILVGIDGADWAFIDEWMDSGYMPNLASLVKSGVRAPLQSALPLNSASAWVTIITGRSPGAHGIFGFMKNDPGGYNRRPVCPGDIATAAIWDIVNAADEPIGVINCPITYPPPTLNGFIVSGILVPYNGLWAYPPEVESTLRGLFGPYMVDVPWASVDETTPGDREKFLADMYLMTRKQEEVALKCSATWPWRVLAVFITGTDRIMHRFWHHTDKNHPQHDPKAAKVFRDEIRKYFTLIDGVIGRIIGKNPGVPIIVVSDHGFGPLYYRFCLRNWLEERGYLVESKNSKSTDVDEALRGIDFARSKAFPASLSESGVWINLKGRQPKGIVPPKEYEKIRSHIIGDLLKLMLEGGLRPVKRAMKREEVLSGDLVNNAPDILIEAADLFIVDDAASDKTLGHSARETGAHRPMGIFSASGEGFERGVSLSPLNIADVLSTLLAASGLPIPEDIEGRVVEDAFENTPKLVRCPPVRKNNQRSGAADAAEDEKKKAQLKGLGYL